MSELWKSDRESQDTLLPPREKDDPEMFQHTTKEKKYHFLVPLFAGLVIASVFWSLVALTIGHPNVRPAPTESVHIQTQQTPYVIRCGTNPQAARAAGCKFQLWMFAWVPQQCADDEIEREYLATIDWGYYFDQAGRHEVNVSVAASGDHVIWTTWGQHYWHCFFTVKKLVRSVAIHGSGVGLTEADIGPNNTHMNHCLDSMLNKDAHPWDEIMDEMYANYADCYMNGKGNWDPVKWELSSHEGFRLG